jgi:hypothetical protein
MVCLYGEAEEDGGRREITGSDMQNGGESGEREKMSRRRGFFGFLLYLQAVMPVSSSTSLLPRPRSQRLSCEVDSIDPPM